MKLFSYIAVFSLVLVSCSSSHKEEAMKLNKMVDGYDKEARSLITNNRDKKSNELLLKSAKSLISQAGPILLAYSKKYPQCEGFLKGVIDSADKMQALSLHQIEKQYHDGEALPKSDEVCFEAKELIVHPATVVIISKKKRLKKGDRRQINDEISEVLGHLEMFKESI
ncbi:hypothetical protein [Bacteriovorax sp. DB6_IX]|uniref:hypothetical protein n=1 Tax=Bacteriovorax sp. DB6_IX TaxID=1353530 RepID=UPI00038A1001|nr:hypothetical protein [Bacteriovorax sp. DB6_IX]EQC51229.1 hypothetical protein M901_1799 [Bacteriovorax sp. DB6_IX]